MENEILKAIKEDRLYDFIANHYWEIDREIMRDLFLEVYFCLRFEDSDFYLGKQINEFLIESLKENRDWEE